MCFEGIWLGRFGLSLIDGRIGCGLKCGDRVGGWKSRERMRLLKGFLVALFSAVNLSRVGFFYAVFVFRLDS